KKLAPRLYCNSHFSTSKISLEAFLSFFLIFSIFWLCISSYCHDISHIPTVSMLLLCLSRELHTSWHFSHMQSPPHTHTHTHTHTSGPYQGYNRDQTRRNISGLDPDHIRIRSGPHQDH